MIFKRFPLLVLAFILSVVWGCAEKNSRSKVVARVGQEVLTLEMIDKAIPIEYAVKINEAEKKDYVLRWINNELLYQEALRNKLDKDIQLQEELEKFKKEYVINKLLEIKIDKAIGVTAEEINKYYEENKEDFVREQEEIRLAHILVRRREQARTVRNELIRGRKLEEIAREQNLIQSLVGYWDTGYITREKIISAIAEVAFKMKVGKISKPIKTEFGYHVVKVLDKKAKGTLRELDLVRGEIEARLKTNKRRKGYNKLLGDLRNKADLWMNLKLLEETQADSSAMK